MGIARLALPFEVQVVCFGIMDRKPGQQALNAAISLGGLNERLDGAVKIAKWLYGGTITAIVGVLSFLLLYFLPAKIDSQVAPLFSAQGERLAKIEEKLAHIDENQKMFLPQLLEGLLKKPATGKATTLRERLNLAQAMLKSAKQHRVVSDRKEIARLGQILIEGRVEDPSLSPTFWQTFTDLLNYQSFLYSALERGTLRPNLKPSTCIQIGPNSRVLIEDSLLANCRQKLDRGIWKNTVLRNVLVEYDGGPVRLEDVRFENCDFRISLNRRGTKLGKVLLASNNLTLEIPR